MLGETVLAGSEVNFDNTLVIRSLDCAKVIIDLFGGGNPNVAVERAFNFLAFPVATVKPLLSIGVGKFSGVIRRYRYVNCGYFLQPNIAVPTSRDASGLIQNWLRTRRWRRQDPRARHDTRPYGM